MWGEDKIVSLDGRGARVRNTIQESNFTSGEGVALLDSSFLGDRGVNERCLSNISVSELLTPIFRTRNLSTPGGTGHCNN